MNPMKPTTLATAILVFAITVMGNFGYSQEKLNEFMTETTPEERAQFQTDYMKERLSLKGDQETKVHDINIKYAEKMQFVPSNPRGANEHANTRTIEYENLISSININLT